MKFKNNRNLTFDRPVIMGILNITPDSFSDGGSYFKGGGVSHALQMIDDGADIIDIGGESTRPGSDPVSIEEEIRRIIPVIRELSSVTDVPISVDTMKPKVAEVALDAGADIVNDVNGLRSKGMLDVLSTGVPVVIMHMNGEPKTMQIGLTEGPITESIVNFLKERISTAQDYGIKDIIVDPGIGFGKTVKQNIEIIENMSKFSLGYPVLAGLSRKRFLSKLYPETDRDDATVKMSMIAVQNGANIVRVHNVKAMASAFRASSCHRNKN